jgi:uncharacterized membrane-anchored protein
MLVTRIAAMSGQSGAGADREHMTALCRRMGRREPDAAATWCALDAGEWQLRWERHSEFSSWTFFARPDGAEGESAMDRVPRDWLAAFPGPTLVLTTFAISIGEGAAFAAGHRAETIGSRLMDGAATVFTDLRPDWGGMTRFALAMHRDDPVLTGRIALFLLEIETYRLMALLAFPVAQETARQLLAIEREAGELAGQFAADVGVEDDRSLLARLVGLSGRMEAMGASTSFRFGAGRAYYGIVQDRIGWLREEALPGQQTIGEFMDRRLRPAMRTCETVAEREAAVIARIARAGQMLNTRVELVAQQINADLLQSMDRRALTQLRLQKTVEGLSVAAISYYVVSLLLYPLGAFGRTYPWLRPELLTAALVPLVVLVVWLLLRRVRQGIERSSPDLQTRKPD